MTKLTFGQAEFDSHGWLGPWSDSMTGVSIARLERHIPRGRDNKESACFERYETQACRLLHSLNHAVFGPDWSSGRKSVAYGQTRGAHQLCCDEKRYFGRTVLRQDEMFSEKTMIAYFVVLLFATWVRHVRGIVGHQPLRECLLLSRSV